MKVAMIDLLAQTPFYDRHLAEAVAPLVSRFILYTTRFYHEPDYFKSVLFMWTPGLTDRLGLMFASVRPLRKIARSVEYHLNWRFILRQFCSCPPNIVHIQWLPFLGTHALLNEMRFVKYLCSLHIPVVYTMHNYLPHDATPFAAKIYHQFYHSVDHIIVHTHTDRQRLLAAGLSEKQITVIPQGPVFSDQFGMPYSEARTSLTIGEGDLVLLMLGVIRPYKGIEEMIRSLAQMVGEHPEIRLWIVGNVLDKNYVRYLQQLADDLRVQQYLRWRVGYVPSSWVGQLHAAADVMLFPYRDISQSGAFLTAAGLGKCTLSTRVGGLAEIVRDGENGIQIAAADPDAIAGGLRRCLALTPEQRIAMGLALRHDVNQSCSWEHIANETVAVYERVRVNAATIL